MEVKQYSSKIFSLLAVILLVFFLDRFSCYLTDIFLAQYSYLWLIIHHLLQLSMVIGIMLLPFWQGSFFQWGINIANFKTTFSILRKFFLGWIIFTTIFVVGSKILFDQSVMLGFELNLKNLFNYLFFEFVVVGISEEIFFRGLVMGILLKIFAQKINVAGKSFSIAGLLAAILFALAHIGFAFFPFQITHFEPMQILIAFSLGVFYAVFYEKTGSLLGPILAHNLADGWLSILYIFFTIYPF